MVLDDDTYPTAQGKLHITPIHHATVVFEWNGITLYCDPVGDPRRYSGFADPTLIVLTHHHGDHFDPATLAAVMGTETRILAPQVVFDALPADLAERATVLSNGEEIETCGIGIAAIAMYNTTPERRQYHEKGVGNGYLLDFAGTRVYLASDTEPTAEMERLGSIDIAFFPMNLPFTMTPDQVATAIAKTKPRFAYPFHYRFPFDQPGTDPQQLVDIMPAGSGTQIVVRDWYRDI